ncbi:MAG: hypothetical protein QW275_01840, partial [Candidatus Anstonellaceae archaeon]
IMPVYFAFERILSKASRLKIGPLLSLSSASLLSLSVGGGGGFGLSCAFPEFTMIAAASSPILSAVFPLSTASRSFLLKTEEDF